MQSLGIQYYELSMSKQKNITVEITGMNRKRNRKRVKSAYGLTDIILTNNCLVDKLSADLTRSALRFRALYIEKDKESFEKLESFLAEK